MQHDRRAERHHDRDERRRRRVIERAHDEVAIVGAHPDLQDHVGDRLEAGLLPRAVRALRLAGRARRVDDHAAAVAAARLAAASCGRRGRERAVPVVGVADVRPGVAADDDHRAAACRRACAPRASRRGTRRGRSSRSARAFSRMYAISAGLEAIADLHRGRAEPRERLLRDQVLGAVRQHQRDAGCRRATPRATSALREPVDRRVELAPGQAAHAALAVLDDRFLVGVRGRVEHHREVRPELGVPRDPRRTARARVGSIGASTPASRAASSRRTAPAIEALAQSVQHARENTLITARSAQHARTVDWPRSSVAEQAA